MPLIRNINELEYIDILIGILNRKVNTANKARLIAPNQEIIRKLC